MNFKCVSFPVLGLFIWLPCCAEQTIMLRHRNFNFIGLYAVRWRKNLQKLIEKGKIWTLDCEISVSSDKIGFIWCLIISYVDQHVPGTQSQWAKLPSLPSSCTGRTGNCGNVGQPEIRSVHVLLFQCELIHALEKQTVVLSLIQTPL